MGQSSKNSQNNSLGWNYHGTKGRLEALDRTLKDLRNKKNLKGGVTVLLAGDFRQNWPIVPRGTQADEIKICIKS